MSRRSDGSPRRQQQQHREQEQEEEQVSPQSTFQRLRQAFRSPRRDANGGSPSPSRRQGRRGSQEYHRTRDHRAATATGARSAKAAKAAKAGSSGRQESLVDRCARELLPPMGPLVPVTDDLSKPATTVAEKKRTFVDRIVHPSSTSAKEAHHASVEHLSQTRLHSLFLELLRSCGEEPLHLILPYVVFVTEHRPELVVTFSREVVEFLKAAFHGLVDITDEELRRDSEENLVSLVDTALPMLLSINSHGHTEAVVVVTLQNMDALMLRGEWFVVISKCIPSLSLQTLIDITRTILDYCHERTEGMCMCLVQLARLDYWDVRRRECFREVRAAVRNVSGSNKRLMHETMALMVDALHLEYTLRFVSPSAARFHASAAPASASASASSSSSSTSALAAALSSSLPRSRAATARSSRTSTGPSTAAGTAMGTTSPGSSSASSSTAPNRTPSQGGPAGARGGTGDDATADAAAVTALPGVSAVASVYGGSLGLAEDTTCYDPCTSLDRTATDAWFGAASDNEDGDAGDAHDGMTRERNGGGAGSGGDGDGDGSDNAGSVHWCMCAEVTAVLQSFTRAPERVRALLLQCLLMDPDFDADGDHVHARSSSSSTTTTTTAATAGGYSRGDVDRRGRCRGMLHPAQLDEKGWHALHALYEGTKDHLAHLGDAMYGFLYFALVQDLYLGGMDDFADFQERSKDITYAVCVPTHPHWRDNLDAFLRWPKKKATLRDKLRLLAHLSYSFPFMQTYFFKAACELLGPLSIASRLDDIRVALEFFTVTLHREALPTVGSIVCSLQDEFHSEYLDMLREAKKPKPGLSFMESKTETLRAYPHFLHKVQALLPAMMAYTPESPTANPAHDVLVAVIDAVLTTLKEISFISDKSPTLERHTEHKQLPPISEYLQHTLRIIQPAFKIVSMLSWTKKFCVYLQVSEVTSGSGPGARDAIDMHDMMDLDTFNDSLFCVTPRSTRAMSTRALSSASVHLPGSDHGGDGAGDGGGGMSSSGASTRDGRNTPQGHVAGNSNSSNTTTNAGSSVDGTGASASGTASAVQRHDKKTSAFGRQLITTVAALQSLTEAGTPVPLNKGRSASPRLKDADNDDDMFGSGALASSGNSGTGLGFGGGGGGGGGGGSSSTSIVMPGWSPSSSMPPSRAEPDLLSPLDVPSPSPSSSSTTPSQHAPYVSARAGSVANEAQARAYARAQGRASSRTRSRAGSVSQFGMGKQTPYRRFRHNSRVEAAAVKSNLYMAPSSGLGNGVIAELRAKIEKLIPELVKGLGRRVPFFILQWIVASLYTLMSCWRFQDFVSSAAIKKSIPAVIQCISRLGYSRDKYFPDVAVSACEPVLHDLFLFLGFMLNFNGPSNEYTKRLCENDIIAVHPHWTTATIMSLLHNYPDEMSGSISEVLHKFPYGQENPRRWLVKLELLLAVIAIPGILKILDKHKNIIRLSLVLNRLVEGCFAYLPLNDVTALSSAEEPVQTTGYANALAMRVLTLYFVKLTLKDRKKYRPELERAILQFHQAAKKKATTPAQQRMLDQRRGVLLDLLKRYANRTVDRHGGRELLDMPFPLAPRQFFQEQHGTKVAFFCRRGMLIAARVNPSALCLFEVFTPTLSEWFTLNLWPLLQVAHEASDASEPPFLRAPPRDATPVPADGDGGDSTSRDGVVARSLSSASSKTRAAAILRESKTRSGSMSSLFRNTFRRARSTEELERKKASSTKQQQQQTACSGDDGSGGTRGAVSPLGAAQGKHQHQQTKGKQPVPAIVTTPPPDDTLTSPSATAAGTVVASTSTSTTTATTLAALATSSVSASNGHVAAAVTATTTTTTITAATTTGTTTTTGANTPASPSSASPGKPGTAATTTSSSTATAYSAVHGSGDGEGGGASWHSMGLITNGPLPHDTRSVRPAAMPKELLQWEVDCLRQAALEGYDVSAILPHPLSKQLHEYLDIQRLVACEWYEEEQGSDGASANKGSSANSSSNTTRHNSLVPSSRNSVSGTSSGVCSRHGGDEEGERRATPTPMMLPPVDESANASTATTTTTTTDNTATSTKSNGLRSGDGVEDGGVGAEDPNTSVDTVVADDSKQVATIEPYPQSEVGETAFDSAMLMAMRAIFGLSTRRVRSPPPLATAFEQRAYFENIHDVSILFLPLVEGKPDFDDIVLDAGLITPSRYSAFLRALGECALVRQPPAPDLIIWQAELVQLNFHVHHPLVIESGPRKQHPILKTPICILYCDGDWEGLPDDVTRNNEPIPVMIIVQPLSVDAYRVWVEETDRRIQATLTPQKPTMVRNSGVANYIRKLVLKYSLAYNAQVAGRDGMWEQRWAALQTVNSRIAPAKE